MATAWLLTGCNTPAPVDQKAPPPTPSLLPPSALGTERTANQIVRGAFGEREATLQCAVIVRGNDLTVVGLTTLGVRMFTIRYDGREVHQEQALPLPSQLTPERLLADLELVYWPLAALQAAGWEASEPFSQTRRLRRAGRLIAEVHYDGADPWRGRAWLVNLEHGYTLSIDSQSP